MPPVPTASQTTPKAETASERGPAPERSLTQRMDALKRANDIRTRRASLKRDLKAGRVHIHGLLLDAPKYGRVKVNRILTQCRISPSKTVGGLSERQRGELVSFLRR